LAAYEYILTEAIPGQHLIWELNDEHHKKLEVNNDSAKMKINTHKRHVDKLIW